MTVLAACGGSDDAETTDVGTDADVTINTTPDDATVDTATDVATEDTPDLAEPDATETHTEPEPDVAPEPDTDVVPVDANEPDAVDYPPINIIRMNPVCGPLSGGPEVTLTGDFGAPDTVVTIDSQAATLVGSVTNQNVVFSAPATTGEPRVVDLTVASSSQDQVSLPDAYYYYPNIAWDVVVTPLADGFTNQFAIGDITGDGRADRITSTEGGIVIERGADTETGFGATVSNTACTTPSAMAVGELTGDSIDDLLIACGADAVVVAGDADGVFDTNIVSTISADQAPFHIQVFLADLDGDEDLDIVDAWQSTGVLTILLNDGSGSFTRQGTVDAGANLTRIFVAEVTGDGDADIITGHYSRGELKVHAGNGAGAFNLPITNPIGSVQRLSAADFDGNPANGLELLVGSDNSAVGASIYQVDNRGSATLFRQLIGGGLLAASAGDLDLDGIPDAIVATDPGARIFIGGAPEDLGCTIDFTISDVPYDFPLVDINGDGYLDTSYWNPNSRTVTTLLSRVTGP